MFLADGANIVVEHGVERLSGEKAGWVINVDPCIDGGSDFAGEGKLCCKASIRQLDFDVISFLRHGDENLFFDETGWEQSVDEGSDGRTESRHIGKARQLKLMRGQKGGGKAEGATNNDISEGARG